MVSKESVLQGTDENERPRSDGCWIFFFFFIIENLGEKQVITRPTGKLAILPTILCLETNTDLFRCSAWQGLNFLLTRKHPSGMKCSQGLSKEMRCSIPSLGYFGRAPQCYRDFFCSSLKDDSCQPPDSHLYFCSRHSNS